MATYLPSCKQFKKGDQDMLETAGEILSNSKTTIPTHGRTSVGRPAKLTFISPVWTLSIV